MERSTIWNAVSLVGRENSYHPIREYLQSLTWDGVMRLDTWLVKYANAEKLEGVESDYLAQVGRCWMISAVARVEQPGCQADYMLVLEGEQGLRKTSLFRELFQPWFVDHIPPMTSKDAQIGLMGRWCVLLDEMETWSKADHGVAKQFISRRVEKLRLPYDKFDTEFARQCVFAGTINPIDGYLTDPTGNRRYWTVAVSRKVDIEGLKAVKDQLWAEAFHLYQQQEPWWFKDETIAKPYQEARVQEDIWLPVIEERLRGKKQVRDAVEVIHICTGHYFEGDSPSGLCLPLNKCGTSERRRIAGILRRLGFRQEVSWDSDLKKTVKSWVRE
jgi:predicted P-loop ATPase